MFLVRLILFPFKLLAWLLTGTMKATWWTAKAPVRVTAGTTKAIGFKAIIFFVLGLGVGLLFAPGPGEELRRKLMALATGGEPSDTELADKVGFELSHAPRTWHLPQPEVIVLNGNVALTGTVPHETGRDELERVAAAVPGVAGVDNKLEIEDAPTSDPSDN